MKRVLAISDTHCGQIFGLTPPEWQGLHRSEEVVNAQRKMWGFYTDNVKAITHSSPTGKIDVLLSAGDGIDGTGRRNGGVEIFVPDLYEQSTMYRQAMTYAEPSEVVAVYGTAYHTDGLEGTNFEQIAIDGLPMDAHFVEKAHINIEGCEIDMRHHVSTSSIPHGRGTAISKEKLWADLNAYEDEEERPDLLLRGHAHYHACMSGMSRGKRWWAMTLPSLQGSTKYGITRCLGRVDFGLTWFDIDKGEVKAWDTVTLPIFLKRPKIKIA